MKEECWPDDPGEGLRRYFDFGGREEDLFCKKRVRCELAYLRGVLPWDRVPEKGCFLYK